MEERMDIVGEEDKAFADEILKILAPFPQEKRNMVKEMAKCLALGYAAAQAGHAG